jgi:chlorite dismutase
MSERLLAHFTYLSFTPAYWQLSKTEKEVWQAAFLAQLEQQLPHAQLYQVFPTEADLDLLLWNNQTISNDSDIKRFFTKFAEFMNRFRTFLQPKLMLWGLTQPSDYARGKSEQEIDPFSSQRRDYLVIYPFVKTTDWYHLGRDTRQGMMNEHIRIGHQYKEIKQLLLYSSGLQNQEFVVIYEMADLPAFSALVRELRSTEARRFTELDSPLYTALYHAPADTLALFLGGES